MMDQQRSAAPGIFRRYQVHSTQHIDGTRREITKISDGCGNDIEYAACGLFGHCC